MTTDCITPFFHAKVEFDCLRLDKIHRVISGNKWFKLRYYIEEAKATNKKGIITFGGAWSNHIIATAAACQLNQLQATGIIRGEEPEQLSSTLTEAKRYGMRLIFISRSAYQQKELPVELDTHDYLFVNEGGYGKTGAKGAATILDYCRQTYTHYCCAVGTGTMLAGIINNAPGNQQVIGISVLKNNFSANEMVQSLLLNENKNWTIMHEYAGKGYAKYTTGLIEFMNDFYRQTAIPTDFVYTGKLFYGVNELIKKNYFPSGSKILVIHSGGLQGNASLKEGMLLF